MKERDERNGLVVFAAVLMVLSLVGGLWVGAMIGYGSAKNGNAPPPGFCSMFICRGVK